MSRALSSSRLWWSAFVIAALAIFLAFGLPASITRGADRRDAPLVQTDGRLDINDVYVFQSPANPDNTVLIVTTNPGLGILSPTTFYPGAEYQVLVDNDGDAKPNVRFVFRFSEPDENGLQRVRVYTKDGLEGRGATRSVDDIALSGGGEAHVGPFDDPFFFDLEAFRDGLDFCSEAHPGTDFFAGLNTNAIVLEVPSSRLISSPENTLIGVWAATVVDGAQIDRMGRPAINTFFIPSDQKDSFNASKPAKDRENFRDEVIATLRALGNDRDTARAIARVLLPDVLTFDTSSADGFEVLNGRRLQDDVIDIELSLISGGAITTDCVDENTAPPYDGLNEHGFWDVFPYLAPVN